MSDSNIRIDGSCNDETFREVRTVNGPDLRVTEITASTVPSQIAVLRNRLMETFTEFDISQDTGTSQCCVAIEEALANAVYHGNLELDSELKEDGSETFSEMAQQRSELSPWRERSVRVTELATPFGLWITICDEGAGFDALTALNKEPSPEALLASGRGLIMMKAFTDDLVFNTKGNEVTLVFYNKQNQDINELLKQRAASRQHQPRHSLL